jgi:hypothetical protein
MKLQEAIHHCRWQFVFKMDDPAFGRVPRARRGLGYAGVPSGTSSKNRPMGNSGSEASCKEASCKDEGVRSEASPWDLNTNCHNEEEICRR